MVWGFGYVTGCVAKSANISAVYWAAMLCAMISAMKSVGGSVDKASFVCLYRAI